MISPWSPVACAAWLVATGRVVEYLKQERRRRDAEALERVLVRTIDLWSQRYGAAVLSDAIAQVARMGRLPVTTEHDLRRLDVSPAGAASDDEPAPARLLN